MSILSPGVRGLFLFGASGAVPVFGYGRWWTLLSAGWLHGGLLHIAFNMMWVRNLAPVTAEMYGAGRMIIIYTISSITGFFLSSFIGYVLPGFDLFGAEITVGASAGICGLLGALVYYGRRGGSSMVGRQAWSYAVMLVVMGFIIDGIDNAAHGGGFLGGYWAARWLDPRQPERGDHLIAAVICLAATALSILASIVYGFPIVAVR